MAIKTKANCVIKSAVAEQTTSTILRFVCLFSTFGNVNRDSACWILPAASSYALQWNGPYFFRKPLSFTNRWSLYWILNWFSMFFFYFGPFFTQQIHVEYVRRKCQNRHMTPQIRIWLDHAVQFNTQHMHWRTHTHTHDIHHKKVQHSTLHGSKKKCIMNVHPNLIEVKWTCQMCNIIVSYACNFHEKCYIDLIATDTTTRGACVSARAAERYQIENG